MTSASADQAATPPTSSPAEPDPGFGENPDNSDAPRPAGASAANAMQLRRRARQNHQQLGPFLGLMIVVASWIIWTVSHSAAQTVSPLWPAALVVSAMAYLAALWAGRKTYKTGISSRWGTNLRWGTTIHLTLVLMAGIFGAGVAVAATSASPSDVRVLALMALGICAVAVPTLGGLVSLFRCFAVLAIVPVIVVVLSQTPQDGLLATVLSAFAVVLFVSHAKLAITLRSAFESDIEQRAMLARLQLANESLSADRLVLQTQSRTDPLTGLANRRYLEQRLAAEWSRARRSKTPLSCVMVDIDHFKAYNDHYGHDGGDRCLKLVADVLSNSSRRSSDVVARFGGEEFVLLLSDTGSTGASTVAELLKQAVAEQAIDHDASPSSKFVTLSFGVATLEPDAKQTPDELLKAADLALYEAKRAGRNRVAMADTQILQLAHEQSLNSVLLKRSSHGRD